MATIVTEQSKVSVLISGSGPVGMTLATDLHRRGVDVLVVEQRARHEPHNARCNTVASRTMEIWRRLGFAAQVRACGMPDEYPGDVVWLTRLNGHEIARLPLPSRLTRFSDMAAADAAWPTPEPVHRASQYTFDPVVRDLAEAQGVRFIDATSLADYSQDEHGVSATLVPTDGSPSYEIRCDFLIGCDGGRSTVRKRMGAKFVGDTEIFRTRSRLIRAPWMRDHMKGRPGWMNWFLGPGVIGNLIAVDGADLWLVHIRVPYGEPDFEVVDVDKAIREVLALEPHHRYEILTGEDWTARRFIAERFRDKRVFICGDSAHIWVPFAGYGMNAGVADAENLGWTLAAYLQGWGGETMLDTYETERYSVTEQVSHHAMAKAMEYVNGSVRNTAPPELDKDSPKGQLLRDRLGKQLLDINVSQFACIGLNYGYYYQNSNIIAYDGEAPPEYGMASYVPSTTPGCRLPHFWLPNGRSLYDLMGPWYTLLRFDRSVDVAPLLDDAAKRNIPLALLDLENPDRFLFKHKLLLGRPDRHVAWRGDRLPDSQAALLDRISGRAAPNFAAKLPAESPTVREFTRS